MDASGQKRTLFHLSAVHKDTLTLVMDRKEENKDTIGRALAAGYRASYNRQQDPSGIPLRPLPRPFRI